MLSMKKPSQTKASMSRPSALSAASLLTALFLIIWAACFLAPAAHADEAQAIGIGKPPLKITVLVGPRNDFCYSDHIEATEKLVQSARDRINKAGGIAGRSLEIVFRDDRGDSRRAVESVKEALADPQTVAMIGLASSERAKEVFKQLGPSLAESGVPWLSSISTTSLFANYPNVFTMRGSQEEESVPVIAEFVKERKFTHPAFVGLKGQPSIEALMKGLEATQGFPPFAEKHLFELAGADRKAHMNAHLDPDEIAKTVEELKSKNPDIIFLSVGSWRVPAFLQELEKAGLNAPVFVSGRLDDVFRSSDASYSGDAYQIARDQLPNLYNSRVRERLFRERLDAWVFNGARNQDAFERKENGCVERAEDTEPDILSPSNLRAIGIGLEFRDMVTMISDILRTEKPSAADDIGALRKTIVAAIPARFTSGKGIFKGTLEDWAFRPSSRSTVRTPFIVARPKDLNRQQLAPVQYVPLKHGKFRKIPTLYLYIDLIKLYRIDDTEKSFTADFYLSMSTENDPAIDMIEFANSFLDYKTNSRQISIRPLHENEPSETYPNGMKIYQVSGKFMLDPNYKSYPFDVQRFTIELRPKNGERPFIVQPIQKDNVFDSDGWDILDSYVSYDQDSMSLLDAKTLEPSVVPFYKSSFVWVMKRSATDFFLRVVVPLFFIAIVAYLAIFISNHHFEAIITIQVTALLSAVALYITITRVDSDTATISDRIFLFNYMMFSLMIGISILRVNKFVAATLHLKRALAFAHIAFIPICLALMTLYVYGASGVETHSELDFFPTMRDGIWRFLASIGLDE